MACVQKHAVERDLAGVEELPRPIWRLQVLWFAFTGEEEFGPPARGAENGFLRYEAPSAWIKTPSRIHTWANMLPQYGTLS